jgi:hypothetical protein
LPEAGGRGLCLRAGGQAEEVWAAQGLGLG